MGVIANATISRLVTSPFIARSAPKRVASGPRSRRRATPRTHVRKEPSNDEIGPRKLIAVDVGGGSFPTTTVDFLVVIPTAQPPAIGPFSFLPANARPIVNRH